MSPASKLKRGFLNPDIIVTNTICSGKNEFSGNSTGLTILRGFYKTMDINQTQLIYPYMDEPETDIYTKYASFLADKEYKKVLCIPKINFDYYLSCVDFGDCLLICNGEGIDDSYALRNIPRNKVGVYTVLSAYQNNTEGYYRHVQDIKKYDADSSFILFDDALNYLGETKLVALCNDYLNDEEDKRNASDFLLDLKNLSPDE